MQQLIIFTDLDGTLLDHETYSWQAASPALERIRTLGIPLILNSSKTEAEIARLRSALDLSEPFIVENGGGVFMPAEAKSGSMIRFGKRYDEIITILKNLRGANSFQFRGFSDMTENELSDLTGLPRSEVHLAMQRDCSEPLIWEDSQSNFEKFTTLLAKHDLQTVSGGRFTHIMGDTDKGRAMIWLMDYLKRSKPGTEWTIIAFGDSANDRPMLELADYAVVIKPAKGEPLRLKKNDNVIYTEEKGPQGWQAAMQKILEQTGA
jgi:mannosyl-3-phosphoglycerate phosphatase